MQFGVSVIFGNVNTAGYGEPGHWFHLRTRPTVDEPLRAIVSFPCGRAVFHSLEDANLYLEHPGDVAHAARYYIEHIQAVVDGTRIEELPTNEKAA